MRMTDKLFYYVLIYYVLISQKIGALWKSRVIYVIHKMSRTYILIGRKTGSINKFAESSAVIAA